MEVPISKEGITVSGSVIGMTKFIFGLKKDVDLHTTQLKDLSEKVDASNKTHVNLMSDISEIKEQNARIETKIELLIDNKIRRK
jgi:hypothetical protein